MDIHPACEILPPLSGDQFDALKADIVKHKGLLEPILLHPDGSILDGRHRELACAELKIETRYEMYEGDSDPFEVVISKNEKRRKHLTPKQKAFVGARIANLQPQDTLKRGPVPPSGGAGISQARAAEITGASERQISRAAQILKHEEIRGKVEGGKMTLTAGAEEIVRLANGAPEFSPHHFKLRNGATPETYTREFIKTGQDLKGVHHTTLAWWRYVVLLADRTDLPRKDRELAQQALQIMNKNAPVKTLRAQIEPLKIRLWGDRASADLEDAAAARRKQFEHACGILGQACQTEHFGIPHLTRDEALAFMTKLATAARQVGQLRNELRRIYE